MTDRSFLEADIPELVGRLHIEEKLKLLSAPNWWNTNSIPRLNIPSVRMSDGPNGVRGSSQFAPTPAQCLPCATSFGSTFDPELIEKVGVFLAEEAKIKSSVILLAPTCNMQRSPLGGRAFESFSEDPYLSGKLSAAYVKGLQSQGVSATIKHLVCNDQEHERTAAEPILSDRALREVYLYPFMIAQRDAKPWAYMTSFGRLRGAHCAEDPNLLNGLLRDEWKFEGLIMSDWNGVYGTDHSIKAGLDLEMPGPPRWRTIDNLKTLITCGKLRLDTIDERVTNLLRFVQHQTRLNPEIVYGDGIERSRDSEEARLFARKLATDGTVLLRNDGDVLPITPKKYKKIAIIGDHAKNHVISGGGSAALKPTYVVSPYQGLVDALGKDYDISYSLGAYSHKYLPTIEKLLTTDGEPGWLCTFYNHNEDGSHTEPLESHVIKDTRIRLADFLPKNLTPTWTMKLTGKLTVDKTQDFELGLAVAGRAKLYVNGEETIDNWTRQTLGDFFYGQGSIEEKAVIKLEANKSVDILVEYTNITLPTTRISPQPVLMIGLRVGGVEKIDEDKAIEDAVQLAAESDLVVFVGGLTPEWESEGFDRPDLDLPGRQGEVIRRVAEVNKNTVVVLQAGSATYMPYAWDPSHPQVPAIVQAWYQGNEVGNAIADVLTGKVNPGGRLPLTLPKRIEDIAAHPNLENENGTIFYSEDIYVGYKHFQKKAIEPAFYFGHGLSYTNFSISDLHISQQSSIDDFSAKVSVAVKNEGDVAGSEVVQVYISMSNEGTVKHPELQLRGFAKAKDLQPGESRRLDITLDKYALAYWHATTPPSNERIGKGVWKVQDGEYGVHVGYAANKIALKGQVTIEAKKGFSWSGL